jgi:hypothetical protein
MAKIESGVDTNVALTVDRSYGAARVSLRPHEHKSQAGEHVGGHYRTSFSTGLTTGLAAGDAIVSCRWMEPNRNFVLLRLDVFAVVTTVFGTAQEVSLDLMKLSNFAIADSGGSDVQPNSSGIMHRAQMQPSGIQSLRVSGATALTPGTATAEDRPSGFLVFPVGNVVGSAAPGRLFGVDAGGEHPLVLSRTEGFRVRIGFAQGAGGVVRFSFVMNWLEASNW